MKKHVLRVAIIIICGLGIFALTVRIIDPFIHYKHRINSVSHFLPDSYSRFINDGISRNYDYDAIITGTSMTDNFLPSQMEELFSAKTIKLPAAGAGWMEVNEIVEQTFLHNPDIKYVVRGVDLGYAIEDKDSVHYEALPRYMSDDNVLNDINYLLDKRAMYICLMDIVHTIRGEAGTTMDDYCYWADSAIWSPLAYDFDNTSHEQNALTDEEQEMVLANVRQNVTEAAEKHPDTTFFYFICPYSICYFDSLETEGALDKYLEAEELIIRECNKHDNIEIYSFFDREDIVCDLSNYKDVTHYLENINAYILECFRSGEARITLDNLADYKAREEKVMERVR